MVIEAKAIRKSFGALQVLRGVDFSVKAGEVVAITGASGAGKSTLLQILGTLSRPEEGTLLIDGTDVFSLGSKALSAFRNQNIGFVFQAHHLLPEFTALENVIIPALIGGAGTSEARSRAQELLETVGLADRTTHKPSELSGGEQQRVAIARSLCSGAPVLLADEPTGNLDGENTRIVMEILRKLAHEENRCVIVVTHDPEVAEAADLVLRMKDGCLTAE